MPKNILVLHGPNLNLLGEREGDDAKLTLAALDRMLQSRAKTLGVTLKIRQSNHEGVLIDTLHAERTWADGVVLNPGALAHYAYTLRDAISAIRKPVFEVHLSDLSKREAFRRTSVLKEVCAGTVMGKGAGSYLSALEALAGTPASVEKRAEKPPVVAAPAAKPGKTIGRKSAARPVKSPATSAAASLLPGKTLGRVRVAATSAPGSLLTRKLVRQKIAERLQGKLTPSGLSTWARSQWLDVQRGAPAEQGQRELLEESLQSLTLSSVPASRLSDEQLVELMAQLGE